MQASLLEILRYDPGPSSHSFAPLNPDPLDLIEGRGQVGEARRGWLRLRRTTMEHREG